MPGLAHRSCFAAEPADQGPGQGPSRAHVRDTTTTDMLGSAAALDSAVPALPAHDLDMLAGVTAGLIESWLTTGRERQLARYELSLEATRRPELRQTLVTNGAAIRAVVADLFAAAGVREPHQRQPWLG